MPWQSKDATAHTSKANTPKKREVWARVANETRRKALDAGKSEEDADASAIRVANSAVDNMTEEVDAMTERLREYADNRGATLRVDREAGVIPGVKILGLTSRNGRVYPPATLAKAVALYEGAPAFANHAEDGKTHPYANKIGVHRNVRVTGDGLFADFHFNPKHALAEQLCWDAENDPAHVGFSHDVRAKTVRRDGKVVVEEISEVESVDLVTKPATTKGLYEDEQALLAGDPALEELAQHAFSAMADARSILLQVGPDLESKKSRLAEVLATWQGEVSGASTPNQEIKSMDYKDLTVEALREHRPDLATALSADRDALVAQNQALAAERDAAKAEATALKEEKAAAEAAKAEADKKLAIQEELKASKLDGAACSEVFLATLYAAPDAEARKRLIEDRVALVNARPISTGAPFARVTGGSEPDSLSRFRQKA